MTLAHRRSERRRALPAVWLYRVYWWVAAAGVLCAVGIIVGIARATRSVPNACGEECEYPHAGDGAGIAIVCAVLLALVVIAGYVAAAVGHLEEEARAARRARENQDRAAKSELQRRPPRDTQPM